MLSQTRVEEPKQTPNCCPVEQSISDRDLDIDLQILSAVSNDTRYEALRLIAEADNGICVCELEPALSVSQGAVSQALSRLNTVGLVDRRKEGKWRYYNTTAKAEQLLSTLEMIREYNNE